jgi:hypothetical protein
MQSIRVNIELERRWGSLSRRLKLDGINDFSSAVNRERFRIGEKHGSRSTRNG